MSGKVFVLQSTDFDLTSAEKFGSLTYVFGRDRPSIFDHGEFKKQFLSLMELLRFNPEKDYFLFAGTAVPSILVTSFLIQRYGGFNALLFQSSCREYTSRRL